MKVDVTTQCSRCNKEKKETVDLEVANAIGDAMQKEEEAKEQMEAAVANAVIESGYTPGIVVVVPDLDGRYEIKSFGKVCGPNGSDNSRSCQTRVQALVKDLFLMNPPKPKKKKAEEKGSNEEPQE